MYVKFEESNSLIKNVVEVDFLGEDFEKVSMNDSSAQDEEEKPKDDTNNEVQDVGVEPTQPLSKDWRYAISDPKDLIIGNVSKGVTTSSKLHDICGHFASYPILSPKISSKPRATHIDYLQCKNSLINLSTIKFDTLFLNVMID